MNISSNQHVPSFVTSIPALALLTGVFFANFLARTVFGPLLLPIGVMLQLTLAQSGALFICLSGGYSCSVLCAGFVSMYTGHKRAIVLSLSIMSLGLMGIARSATFGPFLLCTFLTGIGAGLYMPSGVVTITENTPAAHWGKAFSVHELAPNLAFVLAPLLAEFYIRVLGISQLFMSLSVLCALLAIIYQIRGPQTIRPGVPPMLGNIASIVSRPAFWLILLLFVVAVGVEIGVYNLIPAFLISEHALDREHANVLLGWTRVVSLLALPCTGWVISRIGYRRTLAGCMIGTALTTIGSAFGPFWWTLTMLILQPVFVVCFFPVGFAVLSAVCPKSTSDLSVSLTVMCTSLFGAGVMPAALAWCGERFGLGGAFAGFGMLILTCSLGVVTWLRIPELERTR